MTNNDYIGNIRAKIYQQSNTPFDIGLFPSYHYRNNRICGTCFYVTRKQSMKWFYVSFIINQ